MKETYRTERGRGGEKAHSYQKKNRFFSLMSMSSRKKEKMEFLLVITEREERRSRRKRREEDMVLSEPTESTTRGVVLIEGIRDTGGGRKFCPFRRGCHKERKDAGCPGGGIFLEA